MPERRAIRSTKYLRFVDRGELHNDRPIYDIENKRHAAPVLGCIYWYPTWRQWVCSFTSGAVWSVDCLGDVRAFMVKLAGAKEGAK